MMVRLLAFFENSDACLQPLDKNNITSSAEQPKPKVVVVSGQALHTSAPCSSCEEVRTHDTPLPSFAHQSTLPEKLS